MASKLPTWTLDLSDIKKGVGSVRFRISCQGSRIDLYTGIVLSKSQWNEKSRKVKQGCKVNKIPFNVLNDTLLEMEDFISDYFSGVLLRKDTIWKSPARVTPEAQVPLTPESNLRMTPIKS